MPKEDACSDVCAVRVSDRDHFPGVKAVLRCSSGDERDQLVGPEREVLLIEDAFGKPPEVTRHPAFEDVASRRKERGARCEVLSEVQQIVLGTARPVQQEQRRVRAWCWNKAMDESEIPRAGGHVLLAPSAPRLEPRASQDWQPCLDLRALRL